MKWLVVIGHPLSDSLCCSLSEVVTENLTAANHEVTVKNLYAECFSPQLTAVERKSYYTDSYNYSDIKKDVQQLREAEGIVLLFPTWWFGFPAILKGWIDRVWAPGIAYDHASDFGPIEPKLLKLRKVLVVTTLGAPWWIDFFVMRRPLKKIIKYAILGACARKSKLTYLSLYKSEKIKAEKVDNFKRKIGRCLNHLE